jgi:hypothetical protein
MMRRGVKLSGESAIAVVTELYGIFRGINLSGEAARWEAVWERGMLFVHRILLGPHAPDPKVRHADTASAQTVDLDPQQPSSTQVLVAMECCH